MPLRSSVPTSDIRPNAFSCGDARFVAGADTCPGWRGKLRPPAAFGLCATARIVRRLHVRGPMCSTRQGELTTFRCRPLASKSFQVAMPFDACGSQLAGYSARSPTVAGPRSPTLRPILASLLSGRFIYSFIHGSSATGCSRDNALGPALCRIFERSPLGHFHRRCLHRYRLEYLGVIHSETNLTPTKRLSIQTTSQFRWALASLVNSRANVRGKSPGGYAIVRRAPPSDISQISQRTGGRAVSKRTDAARRIGCRLCFRASRDRGSTVRSNLKGQPFDTK